VSLLVSVFLITPIFGATGSVSLDKSLVTSPDGTLTITLTDADLNVGVSQVNEAADFSGDAYGQLTTNTTGTTFYARVQKFPILDANADGNLNFQDVTVDTKALSVLTVSPSGGLVTFLVNTSTNTTTRSFTVTYTAADVQTQTVKVASTQDSTGFNVSLTETGNNTGVFTGTVKTTTSTSDGAASPPEIKAATGGVITVSYTDASPAGTRTATATVETTAPVVTVESPATGDATRTQSTRIIANITDADSGVDAGTIAFNIVSATDVGGDAVSGITVTATITTVITSGYRAEATLQGVPTGETTVTYQVVASDAAGNVGKSDSASATAALDVHTLKIDTVPPSFDATNPVITGQTWTGTAVQTDATLAVNTSIRVQFGEAVDGASISASDFEVDSLLDPSGAILNDITPSAAVWVSGAATSVFLTVPAMASDAKPTVALVGEISDTAGNPRPTLGAQTAKDGISPTLSVSPNVTLSATTVTIDVTSDEALLTAPTITVNGGTTGLSPTSVIGTNQFRTTFTPTDGPSSYSIQVSVTDTSAKTRTAGAATHDAAGAVLFEIDNSILDPTVTPSGDVFTTNPFIEIDWTVEGTEYGLVAAAGAMTTTAAAIVVDLDTHNEVALTSVTLDGVDVSADINKESTGKWLLATSNLALGEHVFKVTGQDDAGNSKEIETKFTVKERPEFVIPLTTGWNLISLPGEPLDSDINAVVTSTHPISVVLTYDPDGATVWPSATRGSDGLFSGTLTSMSASKAYWVKTSSFEALSVKISPAVGGTATALPTVGLAVGWNLLPVLDVSGIKVAGATVTIASYMKGALPTRVYEYNTLYDRFDEVLTELEVGKGYWVYMAAAGKLVP